MVNSRVFFVCLLTLLGERESLGMKNSKNQEPLSAPSSVEEMETGVLAAREGDFFDTVRSVGDQQRVATGEMEVMETLDDFLGDTVAVQGNERSLSMANLAKTSTVVQGSEFLVNRTMVGTVQLTTGARDPLKAGQSNMDQVMMQNVMASKTKDSGLLVSETNVGGLSLDVGYEGNENNGGCSTVECRRNRSCAANRCKPCQDEWENSRANQENCPEKEVKCYPGRPGRRDMESDNESGSNWACDECSGKTSDAKNYLTSDANERKGCNCGTNR
ncbi:hypothetical protein E2C01_079572 [Portunus trituberculatus]|uniref:Uncharacterized protein n=1 Tax=Portunus trituberculatus TaxID=210409 RepID=A0A5B7ILU9_PORTR|nr:hypothetical protein [Portunus trituberculatus]